MTTYPSLISPEHLSEQLDDPNLLVVQVVSTPQFGRVFIHGAKAITPQQLVHGQPPTPGALPDIDRLNTLFGRLGLTHDKVVVVADDEGGAWAGRLAWTLDCVGFTNWCYLDGGIHAWITAGYPVSSVFASPEDTTLDLSVDESCLIHLDELINELNNPLVQIWDCRTRDEYTGHRNIALRNGHIPGAVHLNWTDLVDQSNAMRIRPDASAQMASVGISAENSLIVHCQTHHRSGFAYMLARLNGFPNVRAYPGSWAEWGNHPDTPIVIGEE